ncbi:poly(A) RNA polymerase gld-2 homolog B [Copidosoma floridanum]|uniref:poly(A) RNA polymerase gld-2 homolog B n=1 Tax=Copidosoma floridanum TaxID=29053 RepID=UPI0006C9D6B4|nr:poly(A) RNA polymerase gld-2 homolog B [Copidosoma floridanum]
MEELHPYDRMVVYCQQAPDLFIRNASSLLSSPESPTALTGLSKDIYDTANGHKQNAADLFTKLNFWKSFSNYCGAKMKAYGFFMAGSTLNGFALKTSDVDLVILTRSKVKHKHNKRKMGVELSWIINIFKSNPSVSQAQMRKMGDKPYIYFKELINGYDVDVTMNLMDSILNSHLLFRYTQVDWRVKPLGIIIKLFAKNQNLFGTFEHSFNSYHMMLMLIHYLQYGAKPAVVPCLHKSAQKMFSRSEKVFDIDFFKPMNIQFTSNNRQTLEELLLGFFDYYNKFNFDMTVMSIRLGAAYPKNQWMTMVDKKIFHSYRSPILKLEEPFEQKNAARKVSDEKSFNKTRAAFKKAHQKLIERRDIKCIFSKFI